MSEDDYARPGEDASLVKNCGIDTQEGICMLDVLSM